MIPRPLCAVLLAALVHLAPAPAIGEDAKPRPLVRIVLPTAPEGAIDVLWGSGGPRPRDSAATRDRLAAGFRVYAEAAGPASPMVGAYEVLADRFRFTPRFPLRESTGYAISFDEDCIFAVEAVACAAETPPDAVFEIEAARYQAARVAAIEPRTDRLPANLLRFYVHFTEPMAQGNVYEHISLVRGDGTTVPSPFLNLTWSLWDREQRRLTVLLDPGRIKRGVGPNITAGPPLVEGETYTLKVGPGLRDAHGRELPEILEKRFVATAPVRERLDPLSWSITPPPPDSREPLRVLTKTHLDAGRLDQTICVVREMGEWIAGSTALSPDEKGWQFTPDANWRPGTYRIVIRTELEDVSGNSAQSALDALDGRARSLPQERVFLSFVVAVPRSRPGPKAVPSLAENPR